MSKASFLRGFAAAACGAALAVSAHAADMAPKKGSPSSVNESAPADTGMEKKGKGGTAAMPSKGPSSVNESAPSKAGKEKAAPKMRDSKTTPNPKTPAGSNESAPGKSR